MIKFFKYEGLGNDFILIEDFDNSAAKDAKTAIRLCDRHFGIGADGVIYIQKKSSGYFVYLVNSDGSEMLMCGNGIRCVAKHLFDSGYVREKKFDIDTASGIRTMDLTLGADGKVASVSVDMGKPEFLGTADILNEHLFLVSMGNPHAVMFKNKIDMAEVNEKGPKIEKDRHFPNRTNVEFAHVKGGREIELVVYERGAGLTLACGTGACATVAAAAKENLIQKGEPVKVHLPGGDLLITISPDLSRIFMEGPAKLVFEGIINI